VRAASALSVACALSAALLAALAPSARALCGQPPPRPVALVASITHLPAAASIVVDLGSSTSLSSPRLVRGVTPIALEVETLAPGLVVLTPAQELEPGRHTLRGVLAGELEVDVVADPLPPAPAAPRLSRLARVEVPGGGLDVGGGEVRLDAVVRGDPPDGVVALAATWTAGGDTEGTWARTRSRLGGAFVLAHDVPCGHPGAIPRRGAAVRLRYVDRFGQASPESAPIRVR
jgi:hypothetical protein